jgi:hypothetical protein
MTIKLEVYHRSINYWYNNNGEVKIEMIIAIKKNSTVTLLYPSKPIHLYAIYLIDGEKIYTDSASYKRLMIAVRKINLDFSIVK